MTAKTSSTDTLLAQRYFDILSHVDFSEIFQEQPQLSGLFLPGVPSGFEETTRRVMVVGMETRAWRNKACPFRARLEPTVEAINESMDVQRRILSGPAGRFRFLQFLKHVSRIAARQVPGEKVSIVWANLFCISNAGGSPVGSATFDKIQALSMVLLHTQISVVAPDAILFTTGAAYDRFLRSNFPERTHSTRIEPRCLWTFKVGKAVCYRTSHPRYVAHNRWREQALDEIFSAFNEGTVRP